MKLVAQDLAQLGIASLRVDKRGVGESLVAGPREEDLRFSTYVEDGLSWLELLRAVPRVSRVFLVGHSEGALVATLVAQKAAVSGLIAIAGAGEPAGLLIRRQLAAAGTTAPLLEAAHDIIGAMEAGRVARSVPEELASLFRNSVQPYLSSWLQLDPALELARLNIPILVIQGTVDLQVTVADANRLADSNAMAELVLVAGMNHVLRQSVGDRASNLATYHDQNRPISPQLVSAISAFVSSQHLRLSN